MIPLSASLKSARRASKASGSLPISAISVSHNPALVNCFLARVTLESVVPAF